MKIDFEQVKEQRADAIRRALNWLGEQSLRIIAGLNQQVVGYQMSDFNAEKLVVEIKPGSVKQTIFRNGKISCDLESSDDEIIIEDGAEFNGTLRARKVVIKGFFEGMLVAEEAHLYGRCNGKNSLTLSLTIYSGAAVDGEFAFSPGKLVIHAGAIITAVLEPDESPSSVSILPLLHQQSEASQEGETPTAVEPVLSQNEAQSEEDFMREMFPEK